MHVVWKDGPSVILVFNVHCMENLIYNWYMSCIYIIIWSNDKIINVASILIYRYYGLTVIFATLVTAIAL